MKPNRHGAIWTVEELSWLRQQVWLGVPADTIAARLERSMHAVLRKMRELGRIKEHARTRTTRRARVSIRIAE